MSELDEDVVAQIRWLRVNSGVPASVIQYGGYPLAYMLGDIIGDQPESQPEFAHRGELVPNYDRRRLASKGH